jgi:hypothetical protein
MIERGLFIGFAGGIYIQELWLRIGGIGFHFLRFTNRYTGAVDYQRWHLTGARAAA